MAVSVAANGVVAIGQDVGTDQTVTFAGDAITSAKIKDGEIVDADVGSGAAIGFSKLAISAGDIRGKNPYSGGTGVSLGDNGVIAIDQDVGTDQSPSFAGINLTGAVTATDQTITAGSFVGDGSGLTNISAGSLSGIKSEQIEDETIVAADIGAGAVESSEIKDGTIVDADVGSGAAIAFSKLAIDGTNIRSVTPYSGGTGVSVAANGVVAIGRYTHCHPL
jgi:hypothetical protein